MKKIAPFWVGIIALVAIIGTYGMGYYGGFFGTPAGGVNDDQVATTTTLASGQVGQTIYLSTQTAKQVDISVEDRYTPGTKLDVIARCYKLPVNTNSWDLLSDIATTDTNDLQLSPGDRIKCLVGNDNATSYGFVAGVAVGQNGTAGWYVEPIDYTVGDAPAPTAKPQRYLVKQSKTQPTVYVYDNTDNTVISTTSNSAVANQTISEGSNYKLRVSIQPAGEEAYGHPIEPDVTGLDYSNVACLEWNRTIILKEDLQMKNIGASATEWKTRETPALISAGVGNATKCWKVPHDIMDGNELQFAISLKGNPDTTFGAGTNETMKLSVFDVSVWHDTTSSAPRGFEAFKYDIVDNNDNNIGLQSAREITATIGLKLS